jgi:hypothetical protein
VLVKVLASLVSGNLASNPNVAIQMLHGLEGVENNDFPPVN